MAIDDQYVLSSYKNAVAELKHVENMWNPFQLIYVHQSGAEVNQWGPFITSMVHIGAMVMVVMALLRLISVLMDELHNVPASTAFIGVLLEFGFCGAILFNYTWFAELFPNIFHMLTRAIYTGYDTALQNDIAKALSAVAMEKTSEDKWQSLTLSLSSIPQAISNLICLLSLCLLWVISKYQAVIYTFWYLIGPFLIPFYLFRPFRGVAIGWFRSLLGAAFMGVVGSILYVLLQKSDWIIKAYASGENSSYVSALVFGLCCLFLTFSIPSLSQVVFSGISASLSRGAYAMGSVLSTGVGAGVAAAGGAAVASGLTVRGIGGGVGALSRYRQTADSGMGYGERMMDALRHRSKALNPEGAMGQFHDGGAAMARLGTRAVMSQLPSALGRAARAMGGNSYASPAQRKRESSLAQAAIQGRIKEVYGEGIAQGLDFSKWAFNRKADESFEDAVDRNFDRFERQAQNMKDATDIRAHLVKAYGEKEAAEVHVDPRRNWNLPAGENRDAALALAARQAYERNRRLSDIGAVRNAAVAIVGADRADRIDWSQVRPMTLKRGQDQESAAFDYAMTLLYKAKAFTPEEVRTHDHTALRREMARKMGGMDKIADIKIPEDWRVKPRRGQKREDAIRGSAVALLQHLGKIDRAGENRIADVHSVRARLRNRQKKNPENPESPTV